MRGPNQNHKLVPRIDRATVLFVVWLFIGLFITGDAVEDILTGGFEESWLLLLGGGMLLVFILRDWFLRDGGEFESRKNDVFFIGMTGFVVLVILVVIARSLVVS